jgi:hypothetical protein
MHRRHGLMVAIDVMSKNYRQFWQGLAFPNQLGEVFDRDELVVGVKEVLEQTFILTEPRRHETVFVDSVEYPAGDGLWSSHVQHLISTLLGKV